MPDCTQAQCQEWIEAGCATAGGPGAYFPNTNNDIGFDQYNRAVETLKPKLVFYMVLPDNGL